jgi:hypothetical protein
MSRIRAPRSRFAVVVRRINSDLMTYHFPLRMDCVVQLQLPASLTIKEAARVCAMIRTLPYGK